MLEDFRMSILKVERISSSDTISLSHLSHISTDAFPPQPPSCKALGRLSQGVHWVRAKESEEGVMIMHTPRLGQVKVTLSRQSSPSYRSSTVFLAHTRDDPEAGVTGRLG